MITSKLIYTRRDGVSATVKRFYLFGYLVAWRTVDTWESVPFTPMTAHSGGPGAPGSWGSVVPVMPTPPPTRKVSP